MIRFVVNYAGAWLCGFERRKLPKPTTPGPGGFGGKIDFTYVPVWGGKEGRKNYGELAESIADVIRRGGVNCRITDDRCPGCDGVGYIVKPGAMYDPPEQEPCPVCGP